MFISRQQEAGAEEGGDGEAPAEEVVPPEEGEAPQEPGEAAEGDVTLTTNEGETQDV